MLKNIDLKKIEYKTLANATIMLLEEIKDRAYHSESALNYLDIPQEGTIEEIIEFESSEEFEEALRQDQIEDLFVLSIEEAIANLKDDVNEED